MRTVVNALKMYMIPIPAIMTVVGEAFANLDIIAMIIVGTKENTNARMTSDCFLCLLLFLLAFQILHLRILLWYMDPQEGSSGHFA